MKRVKTPAPPFLAWPSSPKRGELEKAKISVLMRFILRVGFKSLIKKSEKM